MQYIILKLIKEERKVLGLVTTNHNQDGGFTQLKRSQTELLDGDYWIFPVSHSGLRKYKKGKLTKKERFYDYE